MFDTAKASKKVQRIKAGETAELSRSQIVSVMFDIRDITDGLDDGMAEECRHFYRALRNDRRKERYDRDKLMDTYDEIDTEFRRIKGGGSSYDEEIDTLFISMLRSVNGYLLKKEIKGIDHDELYGVMEVSLFATLEFFAWVMLEYDSDLGRNWYRKSMVTRSDADTADHLLEYYDLTQAELEAMSKDITGLEMESDDALKMTLFGAAFKIIAQVCADQMSMDAVITLRKEGDLPFIKDFCRAGFTSDGSDFEDNLENLGTFLVAVYMKDIEKTRKSLIM